MDLLALPDRTGAPLNVFFGKDDGSFVDSGISTIAFGNYSTAVVADFDGNGSPDIAVVDGITGVVSILLNTNSFKPTSTTLSQLPGDVVVGGPLTLSATVTGKQGTPTGTLEFKESGVAQSTTSLNNGAAQATITAAPSAGTYSFTALYTGDGTFGGSLSQRCR